MSTEYYKKVNIINCIEVKEKCELNIKTQKVRK